MKAIINGKVITKNGLLSGKAVLYDDSIIDIVQETELKRVDIEETIDAGGLYISPGFIDIHTHGAAGCDTMDGSEDAVETIGRAKAATGVTGYLPTTMTMDWDLIKKSLCSIEAVRLKNIGVRVLGCNLEGPFISAQYPGAQDPAFIRKPDFSLIKDYKGLIRIVAMAPELEGSQIFIESCRNEGIVVSIGHSNATYEEAVKAIEWGAVNITHTFNAMTPLNHRNPGIVGAAMENANVNCELIADNIHVHPAAQRILLQAKGIGRITLVTDSMRAAGMDEGQYDLGGQRVLVKNGSARLENGTLAGSILGINTALKNFRKNTGVSIEDAVKTVTQNPARLLSMENSIGSLEKGRNADIVIFNHEFDIKYTIVGGHVVYKEHSNA